MSGAVAEKQGNLQNDMQLVYYVVKGANSQLTESKLVTECSFRNEQGKWGPDKSRLKVALDELKKEGYIQEGEKIGVGLFKREPVLVAVKELPRDEFVNKKLG